MMKILSTLSLLIFSLILRSQDAPNLANMSGFSGNTQEQNKIGSVPVNLYTGMPSISVPVYSYNNPACGLNWNVSLDYFAGGTQVSESSSNVGLGWFLSATGSITRTVRGMPDDVPTNGYIYAAAIPTDYRSNGDKYYYDSLDAEQDIFQFNFSGRSGKFVIGKNKQIVIIPNSKLKITYTTVTTNGLISGFRVITEEGVKYDFTTEEETSISGNGKFNFGYPAQFYGSAWYLTDIIAPFNTDTIKFNYSFNPISTITAYPQIAFVRNSDGTKTTSYTPTAGTSIDKYVLNSISFPDKKNLNLVYSSGFIYNSTDYSVTKIKICDSVFRYGFALEYTKVNRNVNGVNGSLVLLSKVTPYTSRQMMPGYGFVYNSLSYVPVADSDYCKVDYWGFYNGVSNGTNTIPQEGSIAGANRTPNINYAIANSMASCYLPGGGWINYQYELNDHYPYTKSLQSVTVPGNTTTAQNNTVSFNQVFGNRHQLFFKLDTSVSRLGTAPISGSGIVTCNIKSTDGTVLYATSTFSLYDLFYLGMKVLNFNLPANGSYMLQTQVASGTTVTGSFPIKISWENKTVDNTKTGIAAGGLRVKRVTRQSANDDISIVTEDYKYLTTDGKSSGFLGDTVNYTYQYSEKVINGTTTNTAYTVLSSAPVQTTNYTQGGIVGYSRVLVYKGSSTHNLGYTVYDFTGLADVNCNFSTYMFPYTPQDIREWGLGIPKKISIYDSSNNLVKRTVNTLQLDTITYNNSNFLSLHLGKTFTQYNGDPSINTTPRTRTYIGDQYYPASGRIYITASYDTLYNPDGSTNVSYKNMYYDTNFNVKKMVTSYDRNRGLQIETRMYYPYNYIIGGITGKLRDSSIIGPVIAVENWITGDASPRMISGNITAYRQLAQGYIKPDTIYSLQSNKPVPQTTIGLFDSSKLVRNSSYFVAQASFPNYDAKGHVLQTKSLLSGLNNAQITDYSNGYVIAKVSNAAYTDIAYTSFESDGTGNWSVGSTTRDYSGALTGKLAYNLSNGNILKSGLTSTLSYIVSVWAKSGGSVSVNGVSQTVPLAQQNGWNFYFTTLTSVTTITISGSGVIDELRLYPKDANMATTTYEPMVGPTSICDENSTVSYTTYDYMNRPKLTLDKDLLITRRFDYSDKDSLISMSPAMEYDTSYMPPQDTTCYYTYYYHSNDLNPWSDTYNNSVTIPSSGIDHCNCIYKTFVEYKTVNSTCEMGIKQYSSCVYKAGTGYICNYHYIWSDCTVSGNYVETNATARTVTTGCPGGGGF